jgi:hypothetical protein
MRSLGIRRTYRAAALLFMVALAGCRVGGCCDVRPTARAAQCRENLNKLFVALQRYVVLHGDLPRDSKGRVSIDRLTDPSIQKELGIDPSVLRCPADEHRNGPSYVLNPVLSVYDLKRASATVIACEAHPNHPGIAVSDDPDVPQSNVLLADGSVHPMVLPEQEREKWIRLFLSGDKRASRYPEHGEWFTGAEDTKDAGEK